MKRERRHDLHTNALADWLGAKLEQFKPYQNAILGAMLLVVVAVVALAVWRSRSESYAAEAWRSVKWPFAATSPEELDRIGKIYPGTSAGQWAEVLAADRYLFAGCEELFHDKAAAAESLSQALERYQAMLAAAQSPMLRQRALFGAARTLEAQGKLDEAIACYEQLSKTWPQGMFKAAAEQRVSDLKTEGTKWFYDQFAAYRPKPPKESAAPAAKDRYGPLPENPPDESVLKYPSSFGNAIVEKAAKEAKDKESAKPASAPKSQDKKDVTGPSPKKDAPEKGRGDAGTR
ncbi:MAG: hypothetical protein ABSF26_26595 [Thermoguttaceae bacterium]|jgi:tetratricopeptide (TPR) repeat protein